MFKGITKESGNTFRGVDLDKLNPAQLENYFRERRDRGIDDNRMNLSLLRDEVESLGNAYEGMTKGLATAGGAATGALAVPIALSGLLKKVKNPYLRGLGYMGGIAGGGYGGSVGGSKLYNKLLGENMVQKSPTIHNPVY